jgi:hypothetical protein
MVASHDQSMHQHSECFVRQPLVEALAYREEGGATKATAWIHLGNAVLAGSATFGAAIRDSGNA